MTQKQEELETLRAELEAMKMKHGKDRTKIKFYKGEIIGFDVAKKAFEEHRDNQHRELLKRDRLNDELKDSLRKLEEQYKLADAEINVFKRETEQFEAEAKVSSLAKRDLQEKLL